MKARRIPAGSPAAAAGFTLIEVVIAFALLGLAMMLLLGALGNSARDMRRSADASTAAVHARSLLQDVGIGIALQPGTRQGELEDGRFRWTLTVRPDAQPLPPPLAGTYRMLHLDLAMQWDEGEPGQRLHIRSLRLALAGSQ